MGKVIYADPPYIGQAKKHYNNEEVDHIQLIKQLLDYDGWALSASVPSIPVITSILESAKAKYRTGAWVKPFARMFPGVNPTYAWEPIFFSPIRKHSEYILLDWIACNPTNKKGLVGAKPKKFCYWLFEILGLTPSDEFVDLFPGTNSIELFRQEWCREKYSKRWHHAEFCNKETLLVFA